MTTIYKRHLFTGYALASLGIGMLAVLAAIDSATAASTGQSFSSSGINKMEKIERTPTAPTLTGPSTNKVEPNRVRTGSQSSSIKLSPHVQNVKATCAQLKAELQNPNLPGSEQAAALAEMNVLHCK